VARIENTFAIMLIDSFFKSSLFINPTTDWFSFSAGLSPVTVINIDSNIISNSSLTVSATEAD